MKALLRKGAVIALCLRHCRNPFQVLSARRGRRSEAIDLRLRDGVSLRVADLARDWGTVFEPAIADVYGVRTGHYDLIVDVGGHLGAFAALAAATHPDAAIHVFEPQDGVRARLSENLSLNALGHVVIHPEPLTGDGRDVDFFVAGNPGSAGLFEHSAGEREAMKSVSPELLPWGESRSALVKLDCEGAEGELVDWLAAHAASLPPAIRIVAEWHPWCPVPLASAVERLCAAGFEARIVRKFEEDYLVAERVRLA